MLGVSKREAKVLSDMAERSVRTGVYMIPGLGRLVRVHRKARVRSNPATGEVIKIPAKTYMQFRAAKANKDAIALRKKQ